MPDLLQALACDKFQGLQYINGYDDPAIIAGAGSIGLEISEQVVSRAAETQFCHRDSHAHHRLQVPDVDVVVVPVGGAGLIAGVALAIKTLRPDVQVSWPPSAWIEPINKAAGMARQSERLKSQVIGVETETCASYTEALKNGTPVLQIAPIVLHARCFFLRSPDCNTRNSAGSKATDTRGCGAELGGPDCGKSDPDARGWPGCADGIRLHLESSVILRCDVQCRFRIRNACSIGCVQAQGTGRS